MQTKSDTGFGIWGNPIFALALIFVWFGILKDFRQNPQWDLAVATYFFDPDFCPESARPHSCLGFPIGNSVALNMIRDVLHLAPNYIGFSLIAFLSIQYWDGTRWNSQAFRNQAIVLASLLLGPLIVVNGYFKEFYGRVRPRDTEAYGGRMDFTLPGEIAGQCASNCSFVSGEASVGGWFLCCGLLFPPKYRNRAYIALFLIGSIMALLRVTFGAHFLSDVLLGYMVPIIICALLATMIELFQKPAQSTNG